MDVYLKKTLILKSSETLNMICCTCSSQTLPSWTTSYTEDADGKYKYPIFANQPQDKTNLMRVEIYEEIMERIINNDKQKERFEVLENFNGDGFTVLHRISLFNRLQKPIKMTRESAASIVFFGPYGHNKKHWIKAVLNIIGNDDSPINKSSFDPYLARIQDEYEIMLTAWLYILDTIYGFNFYSVFESEVAKTRALVLIKEYMNQSQALCQQYGFHRELLKEEYKVYIEKKYVAF